MIYQDKKERKESIKALVDEILEVIDEDDFQRDFFESLLDQFEAKENLSDRQIECLEMIYRRVTG